MQHVQRIKQKINRMKLASATQENAKKCWKIIVTIEMEEAFVMEEGPATQLPTVYVANEVQIVRRRNTSSNSSDGSRRGRVGSGWRFSQQ